MYSEGSKYPNITIVLSELYLKAFRQILNAFIIIVSRQGGLAPDTVIVVGPSIVLHEHRDCLLTLRVPHLNTTRLVHTVKKLLHWCANEVVASLCGLPRTAVSSDSLEGALSL